MFPLNHVSLNTTNRCFVRGMSAQTIGSVWAPDGQGAACWTPKSLVRAIARNCACKYGDAFRARLMWLNNYAFWHSGYHEYACSWYKPYELKDSHSLAIAITNATN